MFKSNDYYFIKYLFYVQLLLKIHTFESVFLAKYLNKLVIYAFKENEDFSDLLEIEDKEELSNLIDALIEGVFQNIQRKETSQND